MSAETNHAALAATRIDRRPELVLNGIKPKAGMFLANPAKDKVHGRITSIRKDGTICWTPLGRKTSTPIKTKLNSILANPEQYAYLTEVQFNDKCAADLQAKADIPRSTDQDEKIRDVLRHGRELAKVADDAIEAQAELFVPGKTDDPNPNPDGGFEADSIEIDAIIAETDAAIAATPNASVAVLSVDNLVWSEDNPRKTFGDLTELVASISEVGVLQPLLVRPWGKLHQEFQIVAGHRRYRAAIEAGVTEVPCLIRALSDREAIECMLTENLQREDVAPLEEAEGYRSLIDNHGHTADSVADRIGKSREYVYGRMKLLDLRKVARAALMAGEISPSVAIHVARIKTASAQAAAVSLVKGKSAREAERIIRKGDEQAAKTPLQRATEGAEQAKADYEKVKAANPVQVELNINRGGRSAELMVDGIPRARLRLDADDTDSVPELIELLTAAVNRGVK